MSRCSTLASQLLDHAFVYRLRVDKRQVASALLELAGPLANEGLKLVQLPVQP